MSEEPRADDVTPDTDVPQELPPLGSWPRMYTLVLGNLALWIFLFYLFTRAFE